MSTLDISRFVTTATEVEANAYSLGEWLASQASDDQAEFLDGFARRLQSFGAPTWQMQCAFVREELAKRPGIDEEGVHVVLAELTGGGES